MCSNIKVVFLHTIKQSSKVVFVNKWYSSITFPWILRISNEVKTQGLGGKKYCRVKLLVRKSDLCLGEPCSAVLQPALPPPPRWVWKGNGAHGRRGPAAGRHTGTGGQGPRNTSHHLLHPLPAGIGTGRVSEPSSFGAAPGIYFLGSGSNEHDFFRTINKMQLLPCAKFKFSRLCDCLVIPKYLKKTVLAFKFIKLLSKNWIRSLAKVTAPASAKFTGSEQLLIRNPGPTGPNKSPRNTSNYRISYQEGQVPVTNPT